MNKKMESKFNQLKENEINSEDTYDLCTCENSSGVTGGFDNFNNIWSVCIDCGKMIEDSYEPSPEHLDY